MKNNANTPGEITKKIDKMKESMMPAARKIAEKNVKAGWQQGRAFAELQLRRYGKGKK